MPEPVLALLIFIMGVWLWDNHFGPAAAYDGETCRMALLKIDRDLRMASAAAGLPGPICGALEIGPVDATVRAGVENLRILADQKALDDEGVYALLVLEAVKQGANPATVSFPGVEVTLPNAGAVARRFVDGTDRWWDAAYLKGIRDVGGPALLPAEYSISADPRNHGLVKRAGWARGSVLVLALMGVGFLPRALRAIREALHSHPHGYTSGWKPGLGLGIFLLAYLASVGFSQGIQGIMRGPADGSAPVRLSMPVLLALETAAKLLPALVAMALLFRSGEHALSRMGLRKRPDLGLVLGMFALLTSIDRLLRPTLGGLGSIDPAGGLSSGDAGGWGLAYMAVAACLAAPVTEEILFRGVLFQTLANRFPVLAATLISALVFAVVHFYDAYGLVSVGLVGVACALCFRARGALSSAILLHIFYNSAIKFPEWTIYHGTL